MYSQFSSEYVQAERNYRAESARRSLKPSRRRAKALDASEHRALTSRKH